MDEIGLESARSGLATRSTRPAKVRDEIGLPCVLRPSFTMGGSGGGIAYNRDEFDGWSPTASSSARSAVDPGRGERDRLERI